MKGTNPSTNGDEWTVKRKVLPQYTLFGALFGLLFPISSSLFLVLDRGYPLTLNSVVLLQAQNPLLWVIDTAPFFLGLFAAFAGVRQTRLLQLNQELKTEIGEHSQTVKQLQEVKSELEVLVDKQLVRLTAAGEVARRTAAIHDLDELLADTVALISEHFNFYHAGIFLIDDRGEFAILTAASSSGGQVMLADHHKLEVGRVGLVGYVAAKGEPRIALDVGADAVYFDNPNLPDTHSEIALPLKIGGKVIGVLDVQSRQAQAFDENDFQVLGTLADQIALAIENARLLAESQQALDELESHYRLKTKSSWSRRLGGEKLAFAYDRLGVKPAGDLVEWEDGVLSDEKSIKLPVVLRGQKLGVIVLVREGEGPDWSADEIETIKSTLDQLTLSLENARLLEDLQQQVEREHFIADFTAKLWASSDLDTIARTGLKELGRALNASEATIALGPSSDGKE